MRKYELSISADYVPGWGVTEAVREFFQNSIDEETRDSSNKMLFEYDEAEEKLIIGNKHSELDIKTLLFGTTTKNDDDAMIGNHGEGYKIATVVLLRLGKTVVFNNYCRHEVWRPRLVKSRKYDGALVPTFFVETAAVWEKVPDHSLIIEISGITPEEYEAVKKSNLHLQRDYKKIETIYGDILESPEHKGKIFVGGLYICEESRLDIGVNFKPCYVRLERDRSMVDSFDVRWYASKMVEDAKNAELLKKSIDSYSGQYILCECVPEDLKKRGYKPVIVSEVKKKVILASTYFEDVEEENRKIRESQKPLCERFCDFAERIESKLSEDEIIELYGFLDELSDEEEEKEE